jgi:hypothetical protein
MGNRVQRWISLTVCSTLCGGLSLVGVVGIGGNAGAIGPALTVTPNTLNFGSTTLGTVAGPKPLPADVRHEAGS